MSLQVFPVLGGARYSNDFNDNRPGGRTHLGNDLFNAEGTPLIAVDDGNIRFGTDVLGGNIANLRANDNTRYYYAHLSGFSGTNRFVRKGETIGYLGKTGNAATTSPHLHFEIHPNGGVATNPFPILRVAPIQQNQGQLPKLNNTYIVSSLLIAGSLGLAVWAALNPGTIQRWLKI